MTETDSTTERDTSCAARISSRLRGREEQFALFFGDLYDLDQIDVIKLAVENASELPGDFELDGREQCILLLAETETDGIPFPDESHEPSDLDTEFDGLYDKCRTAIEEYRDEHSVSDDVLAVGTTVQMRVELSTGGPADYLTCEVDTSDRTVSDVEYHFADWFDHAKRSVDSGPLVSLCEYFAEIVDLGDHGGERY